MGWAFDLTDVVALSIWAAAVIAAFLVVVCALAFVRAGSDARSVTVARVALVLIAALVGLVVIDHVARRDRAGDRHALDARAHELTARAIMPGSALSCLDAIAGDMVESSCEKALFATPEATASAVSYVAAQLSLLAAGHEHARRGDRGYESTLANLRRSVELDRFGIVAHVLAVRDGCTPEQCGAFALLHDTSRVSVNMAGRTYDTLVNRHVAGWPSAGNRPVAANAPGSVAEAPAAAPAAKVPNNLFFPSSSSIPAVSIMNAEPGGPHDTTGSAETATPTPPRKPPQAQARPPANSPAAARPAPLPLAPSGQ